MMMTLSVVQASIIYIIISSLQITNTKKGLVKRYYRYYWLQYNLASVYFCYLPGTTRLRWTECELILAQPFAACYHLSCRAKKTLLWKHQSL